MNIPTLLITGGCGYLGAHLLREMATDRNFNGVRVRILDNLSSGTIASLCNLPSGPEFEFIEGDILSPSLTRLALKDVDWVIHLAALVSTPFSFNQPTGIQQINQWGTAQLLEHCREAGVSRFVYTSSVSVYGPGGSFTEAADCRPIGLYSQSKLNAEHAVLMANSPTLNSNVLRLATLYGGKPALMRFDAVANRFAYLTGTSRSLMVYGSGQQTRPLLHVQDAARAILFLLGQGTSAAEIYNVVECNPSIESLARIFVELQPDTNIRYTDQDYREHFSLMVDDEKMSALGWAAQERLKPALGRLVENFAGLARTRVDDYKLAELEI